MNGDDSKLKVLFVDDEPGVLRGLRRLLADLESCCDMSFAQSSREALDRLSTDNFDVLVTDIRMPGTNGVELMREVAVRRPGALRVALSGHSDHQVILRTVELAHQYLAKPCGEETLRAVINRAIFLERRFKIPNRIKETLASIKSLPSPVVSYRRLQAELSEPVVSAERIGELTAADVGMSSKILQLGNSAFFSAQKRVSNTLEATEILGLETIRTLVQTVGIFSAFEMIPVSGFTTKRFYSHCNTVSRYSMSLAEFYHASEDRADEARTSGLLHDVGKLILVLNFPDEYAEVLKLCRGGEKTESEAETEVLGTTHGEVGAYLLGIWGLPDPIVEAVAYHHCPSQSGSATVGALAFVHIADVLSKGPGRLSARGKMKGLDVGYLSESGLSEKIQTLRRAIHRKKGG
jgi:putative nucleotidyltransferase with HDIG domain